MPVEGRSPKASEIAEMHRILRKVVDHTRLTAVEIEFLHALRIDAFEQGVPRTAENSS